MALAWNKIVTSEQLSQKYYITNYSFNFYSGYLTSRNTGLGNVLFQVSSIYAFAKDLDKISEFSTTRLLGDKLKELYGYNHNETIYRNLFYDKNAIYNTHIESSNIRSKDPELLNKLKNENNIMVHSYLEYPLYFDKYRNDILDLFSIDTNSMNIILSKYPILFDNTKTCVSIHVRTGYDANTRCNNSYYKKAIEHIQKYIQNPIFLIFSDGSETEIKEYIDINDEYIIIRDNIDYIDLWSMSLCKHNITTYSSFSWWGSYLNKNPSKIVTYPLSAATYISNNGVDCIPISMVKSECFINSVCIDDI
jgi:hypothetical protein